MLTLPVWESVKLSWEKFSLGLAGSPGFDDIRLVAAGVEESWMWMQMHMQPEREQTSFVSVSAFLSGCSIHIRTAQHLIAEVSQSTSSISRYSRILPSITTKQNQTTLSTPHAGEMQQVESRRRKEKQRKRKGLTGPWSRHDARREWKPVKSSWFESGTIRPLFSCMRKSLDYADSLPSDPANQRFESLAPYFILRCCEFGITRSFWMKRMNSRYTSCAGTLPGTKLRTVAWARFRIFHLMLVTFPSACSSLDPWI